MQHFSCWTFFMLLICSMPCFSYTQIDSNNYWQCNSYDDQNKVWTAKAAYQNVAMTTALQACKKGSSIPATCKMSDKICSEYNQEKSTRQRWQCTALDEKGTPWQSNYDTSRDNAALNALDSCKGSSKIPETCSINLVSCFIMMEGVKIQ